MLFNSIEYIIFLPITFILYWFVFSKKLSIQNIFLMVSSYTFYAFWNWKFLFLILFSTLFNYFVGLAIFKHKNSNIRYYYLLSSIIVNFTILGFFKYYNFFIDSFEILLGNFGYINNNNWSLNIILPLGISFYTFQALSYTFDIYYKKFKPTKNFIAFATFVSFFPQLVAGPIERASSLLPQILKKRTFKYNSAIKGLRLILWGMFKKIVIADNLSNRVDLIFENYNILDGGTLTLGLIYFSFQIYCDFSGYSDIAIGTSKLFGLNLKSNFNFPYFSKNIKEFWKKWHISLSSWFRDYLYFPLGGSKKSTAKTIKNIFIVFLLSGLWHGANWTFIMWGFTHSFIYVCYTLFKIINIKSSKFILQNKIIKSSLYFTKIIITYLSVTFSWVFFRSENISQGFNYIKYIILKFSFPQDNKGGIIFIIILLLFELTMKNNPKNPLYYKNIFLRNLIYFVLLFFIFSHFKIINSTEFIYFQF